MNDNGQKAYYTLEEVKNEFVRPGRLFSLGQTVEVVRNLSADTSKANVHEIAGVILKDISLTTRVLQVANSIEYNRSGKRIVTVSQAIMVLGLEPIRSIAYSILLLEHHANQAQAETIRNACILSVISGSLARYIAEKAGLEDPEQAFITAAFTQLGRILMATFLSAQQQEVARLMREEQCSEDEAALQALGLRLEQLGKEIGEFLRLPENITAYMDPSHVSDRDVPLMDRGLLNTTLLSLRACRLIDTSTSSSEIEDGLRRLERSEEWARYRLNLLAGTKGVIEDIGRFYRAHSKGTFWLKAMRLFQTNVPSAAVVNAPPKSGPDAQVFQDGLVTITELLTNDEANLDQIWSTLAEAVYLGFKARNVVVALLDLKRDVIAGVAAYGMHATLLHSDFILRKGDNASFLTSIAVQTGRDICINNAEDPQIGGHLPPWLESTQPPSFLLLPVVHNKKSVGLVYVDSPLLGPDGKIPPDIQCGLKILRKDMIIALRFAGQL